MGKLIGSAAPRYSTYAFEAPHTACSMTGANPETQPVSTAQLFFHIRKTEAVPAVSAEMFRSILFRTAAGSM